MARATTRGMEGVVSVFPNKELEFHTTRSWDFMGLTETVKRNLAVERDVIVGIIDSGIWPESPSFNDNGIGPIPKKWKGVCQGGFNFTCNRKLIGARFYSDDGTARDNAGGHGTRTASTVAGMLVRNASFSEIAKGIARGAVPSARIAIYKPCDTTKVCRGFTALLAAFDDAIADGVDIISISMGNTDVSGGFIDDVFSIGSFHAMERNILTVQSAGNAGKRLGITISTTPWLLSVAASSMDRRIVNKVVVDNAMPFVSFSVNPYTSKNLPVLNAEDLVTQQCDIHNARICSMKHCLNASVLENNIIMCDARYGLRDNDGNGNTEQSALAGIISPDDSGYSTESIFLGAWLTTLDYEVLQNYKAIKRSVVKATILKSEAIKVNTPLVASFSSRGPNSVLPEILKPDITGPGVEVLAATPQGYKIMSGTSMSCPHVAGAAAYVKSFHPNWSASAIKSALMTTAWPLNPNLLANEEAEFAYGSGHVDPTRAVDPGLVYDTSKDDYIALLFSLGYNKTAVSIISGKPTQEPVSNSTHLLPKDLNYPSMMAVIKPFRRFQVGFQRRVTNVGAPNSVYEAIVTRPILENFTVTVSPSVLRFKSLKQTKSFKVNVVGDGQPGGILISSDLVWSDGSHEVRSPIVIYTSLSSVSLSSRFRALMEFKQA